MSAQTICANLRRAGLLTVAERAAKKAGLTLGDCIRIGATHPGHVALWNALTKEGRTAREIAALVCRTEDEVRVVLTATPAPAPPTFTAETVAAMIDQAMAPLRREVERLIRTFCGKRKAAEKLAQPVRLSEPIDPTAWLAARGAHGKAVHAIAERFSVSPGDLLGKCKSTNVLNARRAAVEYLTSQKLSQPEIGRFLRRDHTTIKSMQQSLGIRAADRVRSRRKTFR